MRDRRASTSCVVIEDCAESHGATWRGPHDRQLRRHGLLQLLRQQDHHHRRRRDGRDQRRRRSPSGCACCATSRFSKPRFCHEVPGFNFRMTGLPGRDGPGAARARSSAIIADKRRVAHTYNELLADVPGLQLAAPSCRGHATSTGCTRSCVEPEFGITRDAAGAALVGAGHRDAHVLLPDEPAAVPAARSRGFATSPARSPTGCGRAGCTCPRPTRLDEKTISGGSSASERRALIAERRAALSLSRCAWASIVAGYEPEAAAATPSKPDILDGLLASMPGQRHSRSCSSDDLACASPSCAGTSRRHRGVPVREWRTAIAARGRALHALTDALSARATGCGAERRATGLDRGAGVDLIWFLGAGAHLYRSAPS